MLVGIRIYLQSLFLYLVLLLRQWLRNLNLILIIFLVHLLDYITLSLAHSHNILLLLDQEII